MAKQDPRIAGHAGLPMLAIQASKRCSNKVQHPKYVVQGEAPLLMFLSFETNIAMEHIIAIYNEIYQEKNGIFHTYVSLAAGIHP